MCRTGMAVFPIMKRALNILLQSIETDGSTSTTSSDDSSGKESTSTASDSSLECRILSKKRRRLHRSVGFVENVVPSYDEQEFIEHFRLSRKTCNHLIEEIRQYNVLPIHMYGREKITAEKGMLMTLWYLSNTESFREVADRFNVTKSSVHRIIRKITTHFVENSQKYIQWPDNERKKVIRRGFQDMKGITGIIGAIDGCHVKIKRPIKDSEVYCNRKSEYSILIQAVSDHEKKIIDFMCGEVGSLHDSRLLRRSSLYEKSVNNNFMGTDVLLGDSAYPCLTWLIPPFRDNGNLSRRHRIFNYKHAASRIVVENCFSLLKGRFRRLNIFENEDINFIVFCVTTAAVLHNICLNFQDECEYEAEISEDCPYSEESMDIYHTNEGRRNKIFADMFSGET